MDITWRFRYSAFPSPVQTLYSAFLLLGVSRLPLIVVAAAESGLEICFATLAPKI